MKIGQSHDIPAALTTSAPAVPAKERQGSGATAAKSAKPAGVAVTVSTLSRTREQADVDMQKVESVRSAIEQGSYAVNAEAIADKLLANAKEMLQRTRS